MLALSFLFANSFNGEVFFFGVTYFIRSTSRILPPSPIVVLPQLFSSHHLTSSGSSSRQAKERPGHRVVKYVCTWKMLRADGVASLHALSLSRRVVLCLLHQLDVSSSSLGPRDDDNFPKLIIILHFITSCVQAHVFHVVGGGYNINLEVRREQTHYENKVDVTSTSRSSASFDAIFSVSLHLVRFRQQQKKSPAQTVYENTR